MNFSLELHKPRNDVALTQSGLFPPQQGRFTEQTIGSAPLGALQL